jgi:hypothetical protein
MLVLEVVIGLVTVVGGLLLNNEINKLKKHNEEQQVEIKALQMAVDGELQRIDEAIDDMFEKREADLYKQDNLTLAEKAKLARQKFNKG